MRHREGPSRRAQRGLGSQSWGEGPLERVPGNPILLWAGGCWETEPCCDWESRVFIRGEGRHEQGYSHRGWRERHPCSPGEGLCSF